MKRANNGFAYIELLVVLVIIAFIAIWMLNNYYKKPSIDKETQKVVSEQGIDTTSYSSIVGSVKNTLQNAKDSHSEDSDKIE